MICVVTNPNVTVSSSRVHAGLNTQVHSNNMFSRGVKIFSSVTCHFKPRLIAGWEAEPVEFRTVLDDRNPSARYVTVPLERRTAKALPCRFAFADTWMMFSEITFLSGRRDFLCPLLWLRRGNLIGRPRCLSSVVFVPQQTPQAPPTCPHWSPPTGMARTAPPPPRPTPLVHSSRPPPTPFLVSAFSLLS